ncbi:CapA family protein [Bacillus sp. H-16]|uniref:CapA family protein n=1 Tax=Alteribacter salitolerans TaxID=2912333 RepID=UPI001964E761|nr:CapA family protein [Alteribacter salitolerans]MBM7095818.1 CapA family protein [Alteribacter salitolerans]
MNKSRKITLCATGDILLHKRLFKKAKRILGGYDFNPQLEQAKPLFDQGDITIVNQESIIAGESIGLSSFPKFNSPIEIGSTLKDYGVDMVNIANNHVLDRGEEGLLKSIENLDELGLSYVGAYKSVSDQDDLRVINKNGLRVCFLSYTRGTNNIKVPDDKSFMVDKFVPAKLKKIKDKVKSIRNNDIADVIVVSLHFGKEYHLNPSAEQKEVSADLSDAGADIILGHHPHVLQPFEYILNSRGKRTFAAYSLGNFFTGQEGLYRQIGGFLSIDVEKPSKNSTMLKIDKPKLKLTFVDSTDNRDFKLSLFEDIVNNRQVIKTDMGEFNSHEVYEELKTRLSQWVPDMDIS